MGAVCDTTKEKNQYNNEGFKNSSSYCGYNAQKSITSNKINDSSGMFVSFPVPNKSALPNQQSFINSNAMTLGQNVSPNTLNNTINNNNLITVKNSVTQNNVLNSNIQNENSILASNVQNSILQSNLNENNLRNTGMVQSNVSNQNIDNVLASNNNIAGTVGSQVNGSQMISLLPSIQITDSVPQNSLCGKNLSKTIYLSNLANSQL